MDPTGPATDLSATDVKRENVHADGRVAHRHSLFYGWVVVAAAFAVTFVGFGNAYTFSAFLPPLQAEFGASRGSVSLVFSLAVFLLDQL